MDQMLTSTAAITPQCKPHSKTSVVKNPPESDDDWMWLAASVTDPVCAPIDGRNLQGSSSVMLAS